MIPPRLKTSRTRTEVPSEMIEQMEDIILNNFRAELKRRVPEVIGFIFPQEIILGVGLKTGKGLKQPRFDVSINYDVKKDNVTKSLHLCLDVLGMLMEKLISGEDDTDFPRVWEPFDIQGKQVFIQYSTLNTDLEKEANRLLGEESDELLQFDDEAEGFESPEELKARLGLSDDDEEDESDGIGGRGGHGGGRKGQKH